MKTHKTVVVIDFETANCGRESACALSMVRVTDEITDKKTFLIKPPSSYFEFTYIHGIRWRDVKDSPTFGESFGEIAEFMRGADFLSAHNASFDRNVLKACCAYWNLETPKIPFICTLKGCRRKLSLPKNSLDFVCSCLDIPLKHHDAESDALAAARILLHLMEKGLTYSEMAIKSS